MHIVEAGTVTHVSNSLSQIFTLGLWSSCPPIWCIFCPVRASGACVFCDDLQMHLIICVPWHCSVISQPVQRLGTPLAWSATPLSFTWWHWWPALGDGVVVCQFILCARHFVLALWLCLQICLAGASTELATPQLTCGGDHPQTPFSK